MPYIDPAIRADIDEGFAPDNVGQLNFAITAMVVKYLGAHPRYADFNDAIGVLECAKLELYRRMVAPYEDKKCLENGDVY